MGRNPLQWSARPSLRHGFDQGPQDGIDGLGCRKNGGNIRIENHSTTTLLESSRETVRLRFAVVKAVLRQHVFLGFRGLASGAGFLHISTFPFRRTAGADDPNGSSALGKTD